MADAAIDLVASNLFGMNAAFKSTNSTTSVKTTNVQAMDERGNVACQRNVGEQTDFTQSAVYCGSDFVGDLAAFLTQFGNVQDSKIITGLTINMTAAGYVTVEVTGHNHGENAHAAGLSIGYADVSDFLPHAAAVVEPPKSAEPFYAWNGFGVPDFGITLGSNASPASATVSFTMNHIDTNDENGDHLVGKNTNPRCELKMDFEGIPTSNTATLIEADFAALAGDMLNALVDNADKSDANSAFDTFSFTAHANPALATA
jgi:hypothetical protein